ncbi:MAG TPA: hypothetical protein PLB52_01410 [Candidatus Moranbacteria bacterium]|nr:hypothetical protein [Candidatus Moranbacteria bacterium]
MGMYVFRRCPKCGALLENSGYLYVSLGNPVVNCPKCKAPIKAGNINEWELMSSGSKIYHIIAAIKTALVLSVFIGFLISLCFKLISKEIELTTLFVISPMIGFSIEILLTIRSVYNSKKRMGDAKYRRFLAGVGIAKE